MRLRNGAAIVKCGLAPFWNVPDPCELSTRSFLFVEAAVALRALRESRPTLRLLRARRGVRGRRLGLPVRAEQRRFVRPRGRRRPHAGRPRARRLPPSPPARPPRPSTPTGTINIIDKIQTMIYGNN